MGKVISLKNYRERKQQELEEMRQNLASLFDYYPVNAEFEIVPPDKICIKYDAIMIDKRKAYFVHPRSQDPDD
jgi:hypothetical protein